jgi:hypothetical protein
MATPEEKSDLVEGKLFKEVEPSGFASFDRER